METCPGCPPPRLQDGYLAHQSQTAFSNLLCLRLFFPGNRCVLQHTHQELAQAEGEMRRGGMGLQGKRKGALQKVEDTVSKESFQQQRCQDVALSSRETHVNLGGRLPVATCGRLLRSGVKAEYKEMSAVVLTSAWFLSDNGTRNRLNERR